MESTHIKCVTPSRRRMTEDARDICESCEACSSLVDPALKEGLELYFFEECNAEIRRTESDVLGMKYCLNFKILTGADVVELELTSESDLFFNYIHSVTREEYKAISERQRLKTQFDSYASTLKSMIVSCMKNKSFIATLLLKGNEGTLTFLQNAEYKFIELLECALQRANEFRIVDNITYRYNVLKDRVNHFGSHLEDINNILKTKRPELIRRKMFR